ncbi:MAG: hypothetical protein C5B49_12275 [Bdellovibrio sp.]|nr:MAG: hypothetical protein C5B49_12275 [Bdellovibrio sp.]
MTSDIKMPKRLLGLIIGLSIWTAASPGFSQGLLSSEDVLLVPMGAGGTGAAIWAQMQLEKLGSEIDKKVAKHTRDISQLEKKAKDLEDRSKLVRQGEPTEEKKELYKGKVGKKGVYDQLPNDDDALRRELSDPLFRLQGEKVDEIVRTLKSPALKDLQLRLDVQLAMGTNEGETVLRTEPLHGSVDEIISGLKRLVDDQKPDLAPRSIHKVVLAIPGNKEPDPNLADQLLTDAKNLRASAEEKTQLHAGEVQRLSEANKAVRKRLKIWRATGILVAAFSVLIGYTVNSMAEELVTLAENCESEEALNLQASRVAAKTGVDPDVIADRFIQACAR